jgi:hypothetical protein
VLAGLFVAVHPLQSVAQGITPVETPHPLKAEQVVAEVRDYRMNNEDRIVRELSEFLAIPNVASDTENIQKNAAHLREMLEARGIETHLLAVTGRGPVVVCKLLAPKSPPTIIF